MKGHKEPTFNGTNHELSFKFRLTRSRRFAGAKSG